MTKAGLLVSGNYPQQCFPKPCIDVAAHAGSEKAELGKPRFLDRQLRDGTLGEIIEEAMKERRLSEPLFKAGIDNFKVTLLRASYAEQASKADLKDNELLLSELLQTHGTLGAKELSELSGFTIVQVRSRVKTLLDKNIILATAPTNSRNRKYRLSKD